MRHGRRDRNHKEIKSHAESLGFTVLDTADVADGFSDLILLKDGFVFFCEVKDGDKPASQKKLTPKEDEFKKKITNSGCNYVVAESLQDVNNIFKKILHENKSK